MNELNNNEEMIEKLIFDELEKIEKIQGDFFVKQKNILVLCRLIFGVLLGYSFVSILLFLLIIFV